METDGKFIKHGWIWILSIFIFFFNRLPGIPGGVSLVILLTPFWIYLLYRQQRLLTSLICLIPILLFIPVHLYNGVDLNSYTVSMIILITVLLFALCFHFIIVENQVNLDMIFRDIVILNFIMVLISLILLYVPSMKESVWYMVPISENIPSIPRLKLFTLEASHYSFILAPLVIYFFSRAVFFKTSGKYLMLSMVTLPLLLSFSMGVLACFLFSAGIILILFYRRILNSRKKWYWLLSVLLLIGVSLVVLYYTIPDNPLFVRTQNILSGRDTSAKGRTYDAFILADKIAGLKSKWFGIGPGQLKIIGRDIVLSYYAYLKIPDSVRIPNASAETIAYFGYSGFIIRILVEVVLFFVTRVYRNPFRLWLFLFVFIYQFTGSYITNASEYIVWVLVFSGIFPEFRGEQYLNGDQISRSV